MPNRSPSEAERRATRLAAAGVVGAGIAHELRNALAVAESALFLAQRDIDDRARLLRHLEQVGAEIRRAHAVIGSVLGLSRGEPVRRETVPLAHLVDAARHALVLPTNVTFEVAIVPHDLGIECDPILFERVLSNLFSNAIDALAGRGRGAIVVRARALADGVGPTGERVVVAVEDDGPGIPDAIAEHLFEPLVTGKAHGTGLGLSLCRSIVEAHGGAIEAARRPAGGTSVSLWIPRGGV